MEKKKLTDHTIFENILATGLIKGLHIAIPVNLAHQERRNLREISDCTFDSEVTLESYQALGTVRFINCTFKENFSIGKSTFPQQLIFNNCTMEKDCRLANVDFQYCEFNGGNFQDVFFEGTMNKEEDLTSQLCFLSGKYKSVGAAACLPAFGWSGEINPMLIA